MTQSDDITRALSDWAPELAEILTNLAYMGSNSEITWLTGSESQSQLRLLASSGGTGFSMDIWRSVLKHDVHLAAPIALLILEHMRRHPAESRTSLEKLGLRYYTRTLANVAFRTADALYEDAKSSFAAAEIDVAIARFRAALAE